MQRTPLFVVVLILCAVLGSGYSEAWAQSQARGLISGRAVPPEGGLPAHLSPGPVASRAMPVGPVRAAAEWDASQGVFCVWENAALIDELQKDNDVYIITQNTAWWQSWLASNGIPTTNIKYLNAPTDTFWVRDYGPWFAWDGNLDFSIIDTIYDIPRPLDDAIPAAVGLAYGIPCYDLALETAGGNFYTDGRGTAFSSNKIYEYNAPMTEEQIHQLMADYMGINRYVTRELGTLGIHLDTFGKLMSPDTLVWGAFPENTSEWVYTEAAAKYFATLQSPYGWPYKIHRMPVWDLSGNWTAYINALQTNGKIITRKYNPTHDGAATQVYETAAPGYEVVHVTANGTSWTDAIHCRTRNFHKGDAVRIYPAPHWECTDNDSAPYEVKAEVIVDKGTALKGVPGIYWTATGGAPFNQAAMTATGNPDEFVGYIPAQSHGTEISYYYYAEDMAGNTGRFPLKAPEGCFTILVEEDDAAPDLDHHVIHGLTLKDWPREVSCTALDNTGIPSVILEYSINGAVQPTVQLVREEGTFRFSGTMTGAVGPGDLVAYRITATDQASPPNTAKSPALLGWNLFTINPRNLILVVEPDGTPDTGSLLMDLCDDFGLDAQYTTAWPEDPSDYDLLMICLGMSPANAKLDSTQANGLVSFLSAGGAAYMEGGNCWAADSSKTIYQPYFGLTGAANGTLLAQDLLGVAGESTEGMIFGVEGEANSSDHLTPAISARTLLTSSGFNKAMVNDTGTFRTVAASFQLASLAEQGAPSQVKNLVARYLNELGQEIRLVVYTAQGGGRIYTFRLEGDPLEQYTLFYGGGPAYFDLGPMGILQVSVFTLRVLQAGYLSAAGELEFQIVLPNDPSLNGIEVYFQAFLGDPNTGQGILTNRDRITVQID